MRRGNLARQESPLTEIRHSAIATWPVRDDCLQVGGVALNRLAERVGRTPFYAYDRARIRERVEHVRRHIPDAVRLHYAMKANPMPALVQWTTSLVDGVDVASGGELQVALDAGADPDEVSFAGPGKQASELRQAIAAGVLLNVESRREARTLASLSQELGLRARVAVRVNPDFELKASGMKMGGGAKQFGIDAEDVPAFLAEIDTLGLDFEGFHIFSGSQNLSAAAICEAQQKAVDLAVQLANTARRTASGICRRTCSTRSLMRPRS